MVAVAMAALLSQNSASAQQKPSKTATVVYSASISCDNCKKRIESNICYEKGVKDLKVDVPSKTVTITYNKEKTDETKLLKALTDLGYTTFIKQGPSDTQKEAKQEGK